MQIQSRRYTGCKYKLTEWIREKIVDNCENCVSFFDVFAGTAVVSAAVLNLYEKIILNDFLHSNEVIYKAFFQSNGVNMQKAAEFATFFNRLDSHAITENYVSENFGGKYFSYADALKIGYIRENIEAMRENSEIDAQEYCLLLASLLYSLDRAANTVGHYDAYRKSTNLTDKFCFSLIEPLDTKGREIEIYREDANRLVGKIIASVAFVDPPYNSRQYSRFYHVLENITQWQKPVLSGTALKPPEENMSGYCKSTAPYLFADLIQNLKVRYIAVTYNNTYNSKSSSSKNKITLEEIEGILRSRGETKIFEHKHQFFNAGKTDLTGHKEFLFITKVNLAGGLYEKNAEK